MVETAPVGSVITCAKVDRTKLQNALLHKWFGEIARQWNDSTLVDVKAQMHYKYGVPIRNRDPVFNYVWANLTADLPYEKKIGLLKTGVLAMSSVMTKKELSEYMDAMALDMRAEGYTLTDPEELKWQ